MFLQANTFDDLLIEAFKCLHQQGNAGTASRGSFVELTGVLLKLENPRARISRSEAKGRPFSCIGELFWYLSGRNDLEFMKYFLPDYVNDAELDGTLHGAYGPRLYPPDRPNQIDQVINALIQNNTTRRAVIQLYSSEDIPVDVRYKEIPCTTTIQFLIRGNLLECLVSMRSNDAFKGFPHDVFCFTMIQEMIARKLGIECGMYHHFVGSFHLYASDVAKSEDYLAEGYHSETAMPPMPDGDQFPIVGPFLEKMEKIKSGGRKSAIDADLPEYWNDLLRLLVAYHHSQELDVIDAVQSQLHEKSYFPFVERRKITARPKSG